MFRIQGCIIRAKTDCIMYYTYYRIIVLCIMYYYVLFPGLDKSRVQYLYYFPRPLVLCIICIIFVLRINTYYVLCNPAYKFMKTFFK